MHLCRRQAGFLLMLVLLLSLEVHSKYRCSDSGSCVSCEKSEMDEEYCKDTGRKMKVLCKGFGSKVDDFRSCQYTAEDDQLRVILFQALMGVIGGAAFYGVQIRKQSSLSRFDERKVQARSNR